MASSKISKVSKSNKSRLPSQVEGSSNGVFVMKRVNQGDVSNKTKMRQNLVKNSENNELLQVPHSQQNHLQNMRRSQRSRTESAGDPKGLQIVKEETSHDMRMED